MNKKQVQRVRRGEGLQVPPAKTLTSQGPGSGQATPSLHRHLADQPETQACVKSKYKIRQSLLRRRIRGLAPNIIYIHILGQEVTLAVFPEVIDRDFLVVTVREDSGHKRFARPLIPRLGA